jgi:N-acetylmuramoyl-L-alanine amidase
MKNKTILFCLSVFIIFLVTNLNAQRQLKISADINGTTYYIPYEEKNGLTFLSAKELALSLSGSFYFSDEKSKIELKFSYYVLKFTAGSRFVILTSRKYDSDRVLQMPVAPIRIDDDIYIPIRYAVKYISIAVDDQLIYESSRKHLSNTNRSPDASILSLIETDSGIEYQSETNDLNTASNYEISRMVLEEKSNGTLIRLRSNKSYVRFSSSIREGVLYLFLSGITVDPGLAQSVMPVGLVRKIKQKSVGGNVQLEFSLKEDYSNSEVFQDPETNEIIITIHNKFLVEVDRNPGTNKEKWDFDVVVIDAGHGGKDGGAVGVTGVREKDINLKVALKLGKMIEEKLPDVKVVYTRKTDKYVELYKRGKIANENNGKLFISIHCNSLPRKPSNVRGFEVYLLRPGRTQEAISIAEFENSVIKYEDNPEKYQALTDENFILVSMAHSAYMRYSEKFSDILNEQWVRGVRLPSRGIKQAGFYVLVGASMPKVLVELGFLSNRQDEAFLKSKDGQLEIAKAIFNSIKEYKNYYELVLEEES